MLKIFLSALFVVGQLSFLQQALAEKAKAPAKAFKASAAIARKHEHTAKSLMDLLKKNQDPRGSLVEIEEMLSPHMDSKTKGTLEFSKDRKSATVKVGDRTFTIVPDQADPLSFKINGKEFNFEGTETPGQQFRKLITFMQKEFGSQVSLFQMIFLPEAHAFLPAIGLPLLLSVGLLYLGGNILFGMYRSCPAYKKHAKAIEEQVAEQGAYCARVDNNIDGKSTASFQGESSPLGWLGSSLTCKNEKTYVNSAPPCALQQTATESCSINAYGNRICVPNGASAEAVGDTPTGAPTELADEVAPSVRSKERKPAAYKQAPKKTTDTAK